MTGSPTSKSNVQAAAAKPTPRKKPKGTVSPKQAAAIKPALSQRANVSDPLLEAVKVHEAEIARLHDVILSLREQQTSNAQLDVTARPELEPLPQEAVASVTDAQHDALKNEVLQLQGSLNEAWAELEAKQTYLQAAVDDSARLTAENQSLAQQLEVVTKRLTVALQVINRQSDV